MALVDTALFVGGPEFDVRTKDCLLFQLLSAKEASARFSDGSIHRLQLQPHFESDGASIPILARCLAPTLRERIFGPALFHDGVYNDRIMEWDFKQGVWVPSNMDRAQGDSLIRALMFIESVSEIEQELVYEALRIFGNAAWKADRAAMRQQQPADGLSH